MDTLFEQMAIDGIIEIHDNIGYTDLLCISKKEGFDGLYIEAPNISYYTENPEECIHIIDALNGKDKELTIYKRFYIGTEETHGFDFHSLQKYILINPMSDKFMWGPLYDAFPFDNTFHTDVDFLKALTISLKQSDALEYSKFSVKTIYSRSIISFVKYSEHYYIDILYNPLCCNNNIEYDHIELIHDMPIDIINIILPFDIYTMDDMLDITKPELNIALNIASVDNATMERYLEKITQMSKVGGNDDVTKQEIKELLFVLTINKQINSIMNDIDINKYNENALIEHLYETCKSAGCDENKLKEHITKVIKMLNLFGTN